MSTNDAILNELRAAYLRAVTRLEEQIPAQKVWRQDREAWAASAKLGRISQGVRTKGGHSNYPKGMLVLFAPDSDSDQDLVCVWNRRDGDECRTLLATHKVEVIG